MSNHQQKCIPVPFPVQFTARKNKILEELAIPDEDYTDLSPKGSVDVGVRDLIRDINKLPGLVTTSSCAGRISVFLEGRKKSSTQETGSLEQSQVQNQDQEEGEQRRFAPSGGKGAGRWLYVSHDPFQEEKTSTGMKSLLEVFGMVPGDGKPPAPSAGKALRLVRFHFDPLILHIMAANLPCASTVLSAASASGFRESGLQSLRCLEGENAPSPVVAVRSAGGSDEPIVRSLVTEEYLALLIAMSNERFKVNAERRERFRTSLLDACLSNGSKGKQGDWEDPDSRKARKRAEGLARQRLLESQKTNTEPAGQVDGLDFKIQ
ncbi:DUF207 domain protein [Penicillium argentinense]|uniref:tRNA(Phe) 7-[(3-amino-3-carboxypropyl)-4-demethylwyosine(37)-N(4)]-methyltransferase n=1 Tax=Penicillium argentinense TaxID=1131581 RepID=A0A9W9G137_9EURO|nr:DUF207 domain protein [Penicillium argentinense]KAJ5110171.1 DUF207 domain protein [Penicillium argentinense]